MKKKLFVLGMSLGIILLWFFWRWKTRIVHIHAGFVVYENGERINFADPKYMKMNKCGEEHQREDEQIEKAHLHDGVGDVVHVHRKGAKWGDLFANIGYQFVEKEVVGYVNGERVNEVLNYPIKPYDSLVIVNGKSNLIDVDKSEVTIERIKEVEAMRENCGE